MEVLKECAVLGKAAYFRCLLRGLGRQNKKERGSSGGSNSSQQRHALSLADRVRCEHGASRLLPEHRVQRAIHVHADAYHVKKTRVERKLKECLIMLSLVEVCKVELQRVGQSGLWHGTSQPRDFSIEG